MNQRLGADGQKDIYARTEFNKAKMFVDVAVLAHVGIGDDAAGHGSGYLTAKDVSALGSGDDHGAAFVVRTGLGQPGSLETAVVMLDELDGAIGGNPVGMDVEQAHEDAHHQTPVVEVFVLLHLLHYHDLAVGRSHDNALGVAIEDTDGTAEEVDDDEIDDATQCQDDPEYRALETKHMSREQTQQGKRDSAQDERVRAFAVQTDVLLYLA